MSDCLLKGFLVSISVLLVVVGLAYVFSWRNMAESVGYVDLRTALTTVTAVCGTLLGITTAGLMFTQGKFSEISSELNEKSAGYLVELFSLERIQSVGASLLVLRKMFGNLARTSVVAEEKALYDRIVFRASSMFVDFAVLLNLKLGQQGLRDSGLLVSDMDPALFRVYERRRQSVKKEWQIFDPVKQIMDSWKAPPRLPAEKSAGLPSLQEDVKGSLAILRVKENVDKDLARVRGEVAKSVDDLNEALGEVGRRFHEDRMPQLLVQMKQASAIRGKYFYLALMFIVSPLLVNLIILPQFSETTAGFFQPIISITSLLCAMGVVFWLLYIHKILNV